jgi:hypothetical protein
MSRVINDHPYLLCDAIEDINPGLVKLLLKRGFLLTYDDVKVYINKEEELEEKPNFPCLSTGMSKLKQYLTKDINFKHWYDQIQTERRADYMSSDDEFDPMAVADEHEKYARQRYEESDTESDTESDPS